MPGHSGHPASGDLTSLQVREDGSAKLVTTTDAFTAEDLLGGREDGDHHPREGGQLRQHPAGALPAGQRRPAAGRRPPWPPVTPASGWRAVSSASGDRRAAASTSPARPGRRVGVEWEFALVDAETRDLSNEAAAVIAETRREPARAQGIAAQHRRDRHRVSANRVPRRWTTCARRWCRARRIVRDRGMELFCAGTHPFAKWSPQKLTDAPRYAELIKRTQWWGRQMLIWGVHVHVGVSLGAQGDADHHLAAQPLPAPAGAVGVVAVLGR